MVDSWPITLPSQIITDTYGQIFGDGRLRSQTETGPPKVRRRSSAMPNLVQGSMRMTRAQLADLKVFVNETTLNGSLPFMFLDPVTCLPVLARFGASLPSWSNRAHGIYTVALELEFLP